MECFVLGNVFFLKITFDYLVLYRYSVLSDFNLSLYLSNRGLDVWVVVYESLYKFLIA